MQIKILRDYKQYKKGELVNVAKDRGVSLIKKGFAIAHKMMGRGVTK